MFLLALRWWHQAQCFTLVGSVWFLKACAQACFAIFPRAHEHIFLSILMVWSAQIQVECTLPLSIFLPPILEPSKILNLLQFLHTLGILFILYLIVDDCDHFPLKFQHHHQKTNACLFIFLWLNFSSFPAFVSMHVVILGYLLSLFFFRVGFGILDGFNKYECNYDFLNIPHLYWWLSLLYWIVVIWVSDLINALDC